MNIQLDETNYHKSTARLLVEFQIFLIQSNENSFKALIIHFTKIEFLYA